MTLNKVFSLAALVGVALLAGPAMAESTALEPMDVHWSFEGPFGHYDQEQLQRGYEVYKEVCSSCHAMNQVAFRNLGDPGGPFYDPKYPNSNDNPKVKAIAAQYKVADIDPDSGDSIKREATTADYFPAPFANGAAAAAANGGAIPPDMSLLVKAREGGAAYIYSVVMGDTATAPAGTTLPPGKYYDRFKSGDMSANYHGDMSKMPEGGLIAMPPPLIDGRVTYDDKTVASVDQEAKDVSAFLQWAADPKMEERKQMGLAVMIFLFVFACLVYSSYRRIWAKVGH